MAKISKRKKAANEIDRSRSYPLSEAVAMIKASASASKFDETIEIAMNLGVDPRHADQMVRGVVAMPNGTGKTMRVATRMVLPVPFGMATTPRTIWSAWRGSTPRFMAISMVSSNFEALALALIIATASDRG